jgi:hypothetical protein
MHTPTDQAETSIPTDTALANNSPSLNQSYIHSALESCQALRTLVSRAVAATATVYQGTVVHPSEEEATPRGASSRNHRQTARKTAYLPSPTAVIDDEMQIS